MGGILWGIIVILFAFWLLGLTFKFGGGLIHILLGSRWSSWCIISSMSYRRRRSANSENGETQTGERRNRWAIGARGMQASRWLNECMIEF